MKRIGWTALGVVVGYLAFFMLASIFLTDNRTALALLVVAGGIAGGVVGWRQSAPA